MQLTPGLKNSGGQDNGRITICLYEAGVNTGLNLSNYSRLRNGYQIWAGGYITEKIETRTRLQAQLYKVAL